MSPESTTLDKKILRLPCSFRNYVCLRLNFRCQINRQAREIVFYHRDAGFRGLIREIFVEETRNYEIFLRTWNQTQSIEPWQKRRTDLVQSGLQRQIVKWFGINFVLFSPDGVVALPGGLFVKFNCKDRTNFSELMYLPKCACKGRRVNSYFSQKKHFKRFHYDPPFLRRNL